GASLYLQAIQDIRVGGRLSNALYQFTLQDDDLRELNLWAPRMMAKLQSLSYLTDVSTDQQNRGLEATVTIDRDTAARLGVSAQAFQASLANEPLLILAALVTVYIVLGILYESYIHPLTILSTLPSAGVGAILALLICGTDLSIIALIGIILLIGIVKKNAIMMIDFALEA